MPKERADRLLSSTGRWSRRESRELIRQGRVLADGVVVRKPDEKLDTEQTVLSVNGRVLPLRTHTWLMMNKPPEVLSATEDTHGMRTALDLLPLELRRIGLFPAGRLDSDTTGLLLLTNDGQTAHALTSPRHHVDKVYRAEITGQLAREAQALFRDGLILPDGLHCLPAELTVLDQHTVQVTVREGKYHQVKRMLSACGAGVVHLHRVQIGPLSLDPALASGAYRFLTNDEITALKRTIDSSG